MSRRQIVLLLFVLALAACGGEPEPRHPGVFVLGFDGMEPTIVDAELAAGRMPNHARLRAQGGYVRLGTSNPPESPVAWANFITGNGPGVHGVFDFINRRTVPGGIEPYLSTAATTHPAKDDYFSLFGYRFSLSGSETKLLVRGRYFWEYLTERDIPVSIVRIPSNYPPKETGARTFPGMGTPDMQGSYGVLSYYTESPPLDAASMGDADIYPIEFLNHRAESILRGPENPFEHPHPSGRPRRTTAPVRIYRDPERPVARIEIGDEIRVLAEKDWSDWVPVRFELISGLSSVSGMVRLYLQEVHPHLKLYVSPVNADPLDPEIALSTPDDACRDLARSIGRYYTQGMAEDTQALRYGLLDTDEFLEQVELVLDERRRMLDHEIDRFREVGGLTFFYFSTTDLAAHMLFRYMDPGHPLYDPEVAPRYENRLAEIYQEMDRLLGEVMNRVPEGTRIVVMSDHGFKSYRRQMSLNSWLFDPDGTWDGDPSHQKGYLRLRDPGRRTEAGFGNVDWSMTRAYSVGFSGIYLNIVGRESPGAVLPGAEAEKLKAEIIERLMAIRDPKNGERVVRRVYRREEVYHGPEAGNSPDLIVGFMEGYGCSDESATGTLSVEVFRDTNDAWSGSHLMDPEVVPGVLLVNAKIRIADPKLTDLAASILGDFGIEPVDTIGRRVWTREDRNGR